MLESNIKWLGYLCSAGILTYQLSELLLKVIYYIFFVTFFDYKWFFTPIFQSVFEAKNDPFGLIYFVFIYYYRWSVNFFYCNISCVLGISIGFSIRSDPKVPYEYRKNRQYASSHSTTPIVFSINTTVTLNTVNCVHWKILQYILDYSSMMWN